MYVYLNKQIYAYLPTYVHTYIHMYIHIYIYMYKHVYITSTNRRSARPTCSSLVWRASCGYRARQPRGCTQTCCAACSPRTPPPTTTTTTRRLIITESRTSADRDPEASSGKPAKVEQALMTKFDAGTTGSDFEFDDPATSNILST